MQQLLPDFEASEKDLIDFALSQPLDAKIRRAISLLRHYFKDCVGYLCFSGGKDSECIKQLAVEAGIEFESFYSQTTIDPPEIIRHLRKHHADVKWNKPKMPMMTMLATSTNGPPTRRCRWCCREYKENGGKGRFKIIGVRISESPRRAKLWKEVKVDRRDDSVKFIAPIVYWTDADVWSFIRSRNLPYCELYDQGFTRIGCVGCPLASKATMDMQFARWPRFEAMWKRAIMAFWDKYHGVPTRTGEVRAFEICGSAEGLWDWWRNGKRFDDQSDGECAFEEMMMNV